MIFRKKFENLKKKQKCAKNETNSQFHIFFTKKKEEKGNIVKRSNKNYMILHRKQESMTEVK